jgi:hypothetical protein
MKTRTNNNGGAIPQIPKTKSQKGNIMKENTEKKLNEALTIIDGLVSYIQDITGSDYEECGVYELCERAIEMMES